MTMKAGHLYPSQFNDKGEWEDIKDVFAIEVGGQRQDSLYDQLKDLRLVADNIGCFDASDYLKGVIEKIEAKAKPEEPEEPEEPKRFAFCHKCSEKMVQPDMLDNRCHIIAGCKKMTKKEWEGKTPCPETGYPRL